MEHWDYLHCLPYFKRMETLPATTAGGADDWRGGDGPLRLERGPATNPLFGAFFEAAQQAGYPLTDDVNGYRQEGFARFDRNVHRGRRLSAARAYLHPVRHRTNLHVETLAMATGIRFYGRPGHRRRLPAGGRLRRRVEAGEVILCGGAINTPQLLQLSGVGDAALLRPARHRRRAPRCPAWARTCRTTSRSTSSTPRASRSRSPPACAGGPARRSPTTGWSTAAASAPPTTSRAGGSRGATTTSTTPT